MKYEKSSIKKVKLVIFVLVAVVLLSVTLTGTAFASKDDWGLTTDYGYSDDYYYEISPNYYQSASDDYYYEISPNYYSTPSYYDYGDSYSGGGYSYDYDSSPSIGYSYAPARSSGYSYAPSAGYSYEYAPASRPAVISSTPSYSPSPSYSYVYNTPETNTNSTSNSTSNATANNSNTNNANNVNNNVNNNNVNVYVASNGQPTGGGYIPPVEQTLDGSCSISPSTVELNQDVRFSASATGGNGSYSYSWTGSDGLNASGQSFTGRFNTLGTKNATVTIRSGNQTISRSCSVYVNDNYNSNLNVSCYASPSNIGINDTVNWYATVNGGTYGGYYTYSWSGSDGLTGYSQSVNRAYSYAGSKYATVTVYGNGRTATATCNAQVNQYGSNGGTGLTAYCQANPSTSAVGQNVAWTVYATGGNGYYTYSWTGTDGLAYGNAQGVQQTYLTPGTKNAIATVTSNGQTISTTCNAYVTGSAISRNPGVGTPVSGVFLSQVPNTGIGFGGKIVLFVLGLILWAAFVGYIMLSRKNNKFILAQRAKIEAFKMRNLMGR